MAIYKRGKIYWCEFVFEGRRVRRSTKVSNRRKAGEIEAAFKIEFAEGRAGIEKKKPSPIFSVAIKDFLSWSKLEHAAHPNTTRRYEVSSKPLIAFFGDKPIDAISIDDVENFKKWRSTQKRKPPKKSKKKSQPKTTKTVSAVTIMN